MLALLGVVLAAEAGAAETGGYLFVTFRGEASPMTEQVYFLVSEDGRAWQALNKAEPVLVSTLGEKGARDERRKAITMERSEHLMSGWQEIEAFTLADMTGYEGPTCFQIEPAEAGRPPGGASCSTGTPAAGDTSPTKPTNSAPATSSREPPWTFPSIPSATARYCPCPPTNCNGCSPPGFRRRKPS
jgi:hypothetical protein